MSIDSRKPTTPIGWFIALRRRYPQWYCASSRAEVNAKAWPAGFNPQRDPVFAHNEIAIAGVEPDAIFRLLVRAESWPKYYDDSEEVRIESSPMETAARRIQGRGTAGLVSAVLKAVTATSTLSLAARRDPNTLRLGTRFRWETFSTPQRSEVTLYEQDHALGWTAESLGTHAYHRWLLFPQGGGTRVVTEECQRGVVAWLDHHWMNPSLHATHQLWLEELRLKATRAGEEAVSVQHSAQTAGGADMA